MLAEYEKAISPSEPRKTVQVRFPDGQILEGPAGTPIEAFFKKAKSTKLLPAVACIINGQLRELTYPVNTDLDAYPVDLDSSDGMRIYRRSLSFVLITAAQELFPEARLLIDYSLNFGGYYCEVEGRSPFSEEELQMLEERMREIVEADIPFGKERVPLEKALEFFKSQGYDDKVSAMQSRHKDYLVLYTLRNTKDYLLGYMVPSTGYLNIFAIKAYRHDFILQYPLHHNPHHLQAVRQYPKLISIFNESREWMAALGVPNIGALNQAIHDGRIKEVILVSEALHDQRISQIASRIAELQPQKRIILISGPSSSGKTTFSKRLSIQLLANKIRPKALSLDDFLVNRDMTPRFPDGDYDFENIHALDLPLFNQTLNDLLAGHEIVMPHYNFITGKRETGPKFSISDSHIIIIEGIHGLNPELVANVDPDSIFRIYASALTQLNLDHHNRIPTTDSRMLRRIVRDANNRGYSAKETISRWGQVRQGEQKWIFPYQEHADMVFNSALIYELSVIKPLAEPLLLQIDYGTPEHLEAKRLLSFLQWLESGPSDTIPDNSILREFIGGSILRDYIP